MFSSRDFLEEGHSLETMESFTDICWMSGCTDNRVLRWEGIAGSVTFILQKRKLCLSSCGGLVANPEHPLLHKGGQDPSWGEMGLEDSSPWPCAVTAQPPKQCESLLLKSVLPTCPCPAMLRGKCWISYW